MLNYNTKHAEMKAEAIADIIEALENNYSGYYCDLHNEVFNTDYYIVGTYQAKEVLTEYDVFEAIKTVQDYEKSNFGELYTDISNPEKLVNMLYYIVGDEIISEMQDIEAFSENWNNTATDENNQKIVKALKENAVVAVL